MRRFSKLCLALALFLVLSNTVRAAEEDFTLRPGDVLQITVWKEEGMDREVLVLSDGTITFPLIGTLNVKNMPLFAVRNAIKEKLSASIPDASVTVSVKAPLGHKVSVLGQVQKPGEILIAGKTSVMEALAQAGGLTPYAKESDIIVIRETKNGKESIEVPYTDIAKGRQLSKDIDLKPGDVIMVPTSGIF